MFYFIVGLIFLIVTFILLGPYHVSIAFVIPAQGGRLVSVRFTSLSHIYAIEWTKGKKGGCLSVIILNRLLILKIKKVGKLKQTTDRKKELKKRGEKKTKKKMRSLIRYLIVRSPNLLRRFLSTLEIKKIHIEGNFGLKDPALTGAAYGFVQSLRFFQSNIFKLSLVPNFVENTFDGKATLVLYFFFLRVLLELSRTGVEIGWFWLKGKL